MPTSQRDDRDPPSPPAAAMSADGVITGRRPYRFLDETSAWNGAVRLSAFVILPLLCLVGGILMISYETGWANHEDRDSRDMAWDYRVTAPGSNNFHGAYFRRAHWNTFRAIEAPATVYTEVVLAAVDRPTMLALHPTGACERTVQVACLASKPAHRAASAGPLNLGTDDGSWAVGDGGVEPLRRPRHPHRRHHRRGGDRQGVDSRGQRHFQRPLRRLCR